MEGQALAKVWTTWRMGKGWSSSRGCGPKDWQEGEGYDSGEERGFMEFVEFFVYLKLFWFFLFPFGIFFLTGN